MDGFCTAPWRATYYKGQMDKFKVCCLIGNVTKNDDGFDGWLKVDNPKEYFDNPKIKEVRDTMLRGEWHNLCRVCKEREDCGIKSDRLMYNRRYKKDVDDIIQNPNEFKLKLLDYRPSNLCNLKCRMCNPMSSSQINTEIKKSKELTKLFGKKIQKNPTDDTLPINICNKENFKDITRIKILGGEPTIDPQVQLFLDWIVENDFAKNIC